MYNYLYLCSSLCICIFTVICLCLAPSINYQIGYIEEPCSFYSDQYNHFKNKIDDMANVTGNTLDEYSRKYYLNLVKEQRDICYRHKAMRGLEYSSLAINITFAFLCALFCLLNSGLAGYFGVGTGLIGFVLTLCYVIYSGIIFNQEVMNKSFDVKFGDFNPYKQSSIRAQSDGAYLKWNSDKESYTCIYYKKSNNDSLYMTNSDLGKKFLYYSKTDYAYYFHDADKIDYEHFGCSLEFDGIKELITRKSDDYDYPENYIETCKMVNEGKITIANNTKMINYYKTLERTENEKGECKKIYRGIRGVNNIKTKNIHDYWITTIVFSCFIFVLHLVLLISGILYIKNGGKAGESLLNK